jgi:hypothetical protein
MYFAKSNATNPKGSTTLDTSEHGTLASGETRSKEKNKQEQRPPNFKGLALDY